MENFIITEAISRSYFSETFIKEQQRTDFEAGAVQSRSKSVKPRRKWTIGWKSLPDSSYKDLQDFFERNVGKVFKWTNYKGENFIVRFSDDSLTGSKIIGFNNGENIWDTGSIEIEEK